VQILPTMRGFTGPTAGLELRAILGNPYSALHLVPPLYSMSLRKKSTSGTLILMTVRATLHSNLYCTKGDVTGEQIQLRY